MATHSSILAWKNARGAHFNFSYCTVHVCFSFKSSSSLLIFSCNFLVCVSILFLRSCIIITIITLNSFSGRLLSILPSGCCALLLSSKTLPTPVWCPCQWGDFPRNRNLSCFTVPSLKYRPHLESFSFLILPSYVEIFLSFQSSEVFYQHLIAVLCYLFHL